MRGNTFSVLIVYTPLHPRSADPGCCPNLRNVSKSVNLLYSVGSELKYVQTKSTKIYIQYKK